MTRALLAAIAVLFPAISYADWSTADMNRQIDQTNFLINDSCSGTLIDADKGYILTAEHCITSQYRVIEREKIDSDGVVTKEKVRVVTPGTVSQKLFKGPHEVQINTYVFSVVLSDRKLDLALLQTKAKLPNNMSAKIACAEPVRGDTVFAVGNPYSILYSSITKGIVASNQRSYETIGIDDQDNNGLMQISAPIVGGNSGGAVYNTDGHLVGVPVRGSRMNEAFSLSVPLYDIKKFLMREGLDYLWKDCKPN
jgi:S1-C subfamily serine protease